jgi:hypothetical protein
MWARNVLNNNFNLEIDVWRHFLTDQPELARK